MKCSIILLHVSLDWWSNTQHAHNAIESIIKNPPACDFEIILVDNGSTQLADIDGLEERWKEHVQFVRLSKNLGYGQGNHQGIQKAKGEYVCVMNPDAKMLPNAIDILASYLDNHPEAGMVGPKISNPNGTIQDTYRSFMGPFDWLLKRLRFLHKIPAIKKRMAEHLMWNINPTSPTEVDWLYGSFILMRKSMYDMSGGYDPRYFLFAEDMDLCRSFWTRGFRVVFVPEAQAIHGSKRLSGGSFFRALFKKLSWIHLTSLIKYFLKWGFKVPKFHD